MFKLFHHHLAILIQILFLFSNLLSLVYLKIVESVNCNGGNDGSISIEASGGFPPYSFSWLTMGNTVVGSTYLMDLSAGLYTL